MKTIKFRVWDKTRKKWLHKAAFRISGDGLLWFNYIEQPNIINDEQVDIQQFTGLLDKNEKEIYEGDIIRTSNDNYDPSEGDSPYVIFPVKWEISGWYLDYELMEYESNDMEVIGNIYESPELLTK